MHGNRLLLLNQVEVRSLALVVVWHYYASCAMGSTFSTAGLLLIDIVIPAEGYKGKVGF